MSPKEAEDKYKAEWPKLNAAKLAAVARGDDKAAKQCRRALSALSEECRARHELYREPRESEIDKLGAAIEHALGVAPAADVLSVLTGAFVGLTVELVRRQGCDVSLPIKIDGGTSRDLTIHPPKEPEVEVKSGNNV